MGARWRQQSAAAAAEQVGRACSSDQSSTRSQPPGVQQPRRQRLPRDGGRGGQRECAAAAACVRGAARRSFSGVEDSQRVASGRLLAAGCRHRCRRSPRHPHPRPRRHPPPCRLGKRRPAFRPPAFVKKPALPGAGDGKPAAPARPTGVPRPAAAAPLARPTGVLPAAKAKAVEQPAAAGGADEARYFTGAAHWWSLADSSGHWFRACTSTHGTLHLPPLLQRLPPLKID